MDLFFFPFFVSMSTENSWFIPSNRREAFCRISSGESEPDAEKVKLKIQYNKINFMGAILQELLISKKVNTSLIKSA
jgi:hypothetical protein